MRSFVWCDEELAGVLDGAGVSDALSEGGQQVAVVGGWCSVGGVAQVEVVGDTGRVADTERGDGDPIGPADFQGGGDFEEPIDGVGGVDDGEFSLGACDDGTGSPRDQ